MRRILFALSAPLAALVLSAAAPKPAPLDAVAEAYVRLSLRIGEHEPGYVDAYYGPKALADAAKADKGTLAELKAEADRLVAQVEAIDPTRLDAASLRRRAFLAAQLKAARYRLDMIGGLKPAFRDEAEALFAIRPEPRPLSTYDPILARLEAVVPGDEATDGPLADRVEAFRARFAIPAERMDAVMRAAIAECRKRTAAHIRLPADEAFTLEFVKDKPWSGYNWYKGGAHSLIQVNTDLPVFVDRAVDLGCHEGYPGHHTHNALIEDRLVKGRGWVEFQVYPLYSPLSFIAEGEGNYGIELAFPGEERTRFEREVLFPLAGLDPADAPAYAEMRKAMEGLSGARTTIAADLVDGRIDRETAIRLTQKYQVFSRARAEQAVRFTEQYRSYVINYGLGLDAVRAHVERAGPDPAQRWKAMEDLLSQPSTALDLN